MLFMLLLRPKNNRDLDLHPLTECLGCFIYLFYKCIQRTAAPVTGRPGATQKAMALRIIQRYIKKLPWEKARCLGPCEKLGGFEDI